MVRNVFAALVGVTLLVYVNAHGRLLDPPGRSSLWRIPEFMHLDLPQNYDDNQLFCGGVAVQHGQNGGRCGPCGDSWESPKPRENEEGGLYGRGVIGRKYKAGQVIDLDIEITSSHLGYFQFRLCPNVQTGVPETEACFEQHLLELESGGTQFGGIDSERHFYPRVRLPQGLTCERCVLQWHYHTGNSWGNCEDGSAAVGCGPQETFRGCADIRIE